MKNDNQNRNQNEAENGENCVQHTSQHLGMTKTRKRGHLSKQAEDTSPA